MPAANMASKKIGRKIGEKPGKKPGKTRPTTRSKQPATGYLHGYAGHEQDRLYHQAAFLADEVHDRLPFRRCTRLLEVGCGVGAQTEILLRHFPKLHVTGVDRSRPNLKRARSHLGRLDFAKGRFEMHEAASESLPFPGNSFDGAFLCWILEHVGDPARALGEVRRVLRAGSPVVVTEVMNATFFLEPYSPNTLRYWRRFNDTQMSLGGDPFVGAKLGNLLLANGYSHIETAVKTFHLDNREPAERAEFLAYWSELLLSGAPELTKAGRVPREIVDGMRAELSRVARDPNAVFFYSFVQARARV